MCARNHCLQHEHEHERVHRRPSACHRTYPELEKKKCKFGCRRVDLLGRGRHKNAAQPGRGRHKNPLRPQARGGRSIIRKKCWDGVGEEDSWAPVAGASMRVDFTRVVPCYGPRVWACVLKLVALVVLCALLLQPVTAPETLCLVPNAQHLPAGATGSGTPRACVRADGHRLVVVLAHSRRSGWLAQRSLGRLCPFSQSLMVAL